MLMKVMTRIATNASIIDNGVRHRGMHDGKHKSFTLSARERRFNTTDTRGVRKVSQEGHGRPCFFGNVAHGCRIHSKLRGGKKLQQSNSLRLRILREIHQSTGLHVQSPGHGPIYVVTCFSI